MPIERIKRKFLNWNLNRNLKCFFTLWTFYDYTIGRIDLINFKIHTNTSIRNLTRPAYICIISFSFGVTVTINFPTYICFIDNMQHNIARKLLKIHDCKASVRYAKLIRKEKLMMQLDWPLLSWLDRSSLLHIPSIRWKRVSRMNKKQFKIIFVSTKI